MPDDLAIDKQFSNGPFSQFLVPQQAQQTQQRPSGYEGAVGKIAMVGSKFIQGVTAGRVRAYAMKEAQKTQQLNAFLKILEIANQNPSLTKEQHTAIGSLYMQALSRSYLSAEDGSKGKKGGKKGGEEEGFAGKLKSGIGKFAEGMIGGPMPKGTSPLDFGSMNVNLQGILGQPNRTDISKSLVMNAERLAKKYNPETHNLHDIGNDPQLRATMQKLEEVDPEAHRNLKNQIDQTFNVSLSEQEYRRDSKLLGPPAAPKNALAPGSEIPGMVMPVPGTPAPTPSGYVNYPNATDATVLQVAANRGHVSALINGVTKDGRQGYFYKLQGPYGDRNGFYDATTNLKVPEGIVHYEKPVFHNPVKDRAKDKDGKWYVIQTDNSTGKASWKLDPNGGRIPAKDPTAVRGINPVADRRAAQRELMVIERNHDNDRKIAIKHYEDQKAGIDKQILAGYYTEKSAKSLLDSIEKARDAALEEADASYKRTRRVAKDSWAVSGLGALSQSIFGDKEESEEGEYEPNQIGSFLGDDIK